MAVHQVRTRGEQREQHRKQGIAALRAGRLQEAKAHFGKSVSVNPWMAHKLIEVLRQRGISFLVAPFEADPQV